MVPVSQRGGEIDFRRCRDHRYLPPDIIVSSSAICGDPLRSPKWLLISEGSTGGVTGLLRTDRATSPTTPWVLGHHCCTQASHPIEGAFRLWLSQFGVTEGFFLVPTGYNSDCDCLQSDHSSIPLRGLCADPCFWLALQCLAAAAP